MNTNFLYFVLLLSALTGKSSTSPEKSLNRTKREPPILRIKHTFIPPPRRKPKPAPYRPRPPKPVYGPPKPVYGPPKPVYGPPKPIYGPPKPVYGPPPPFYPYTPPGWSYAPPTPIYPPPMPPAASYGVPIYTPPNFAGFQPPFEPQDARQGYNIPFNNQPLNYEPPAASYGTPGAVNSYGAPAMQQELPAHPFTGFTHLRENEVDHFGDSSNREANEEGEKVANHNYDGPGVVDGDDFELLVDDRKRFNEKLVKFYRGDVGFGGDQSHTFDFNQHQRLNDELTKLVES